MGKLKSFLKGTGEVLGGTIVPVAALAVYLALQPSPETDVAPKGTGNLENRVAESVSFGKSNHAVIMTGKDSTDRMRESVKYAYETLSAQGFPKENIFILDGKGQTNEKYRVDAPASKEAINYLLGKLPEVVGTNDQLVVYYDGHGSRSNELSSLSLHGQDINQKELAEKLKAINPKQGLLFVDACYGGGFVEEMKPSSNYIAISSTRSNTPAPDFNGTQFLRSFNMAVSKNLNSGIQNAYEGMLRNIFPTFMVDRKATWTNFPSRISNTNANWKIGEKS